SSCGTLFQLSASGKLTTLYDFCSQANCADGFGPTISLIQAADGKIYGTTEGGGAVDVLCTSGCGTVFRTAPNGTGFTTLHAFLQNEGFAASSLLQATDLNFYGTMRDGGSSSFSGTLFKMTADGSINVLFNFCHSASCKFTEEPSGLIQATNGMFYGTTLS